MSVYIEVLWAVLTLCATIVKGGTPKAQNVPIAMTLELRDNQYTCSNNFDKFTLTAGYDAVIQIISTNNLLYQWCYTENDNTTNFIEGMDIQPDSRKIISVTSNMKGKWNCTFLSYFDPPESWGPRYFYHNRYYLRTNCSFDVDVIRPEAQNEPIAMTLELRNNQYTCSNNFDKFILTEGDDVTVQIISPTNHFLYQWCYLESDNITNLIQDIAADRNFRTTQPVTTDMNGKWNCTFLSYFNPPESWGPRYLYHNSYFLRTNCSFDVEVLSNSSDKPNEKLVMSLGILNDQYIFCTNNYETFNATEGQNLTLKIRSAEYISYPSCYVENDESINYLNDTHLGFNYELTLNATTSMHGRWNCTFLCPFYSRADVNPNYLYEYNKEYYMRATCSFNINVLSPPIPDVTSMTTTSKSGVTQNFFFYVLYNSSIYNFFNDKPLKVFIDQENNNN